MLKRIKISNLLSFGDPGLDLELRPLNVLIGPNGSGKSNLLSVIQLLKSMQTDVFAAMRSSALIGDWLWRGASGQSASIDVAIDVFDTRISHYIRFRIDASDARVHEEDIAIGERGVTELVARVVNGKGQLTDRWRDSKVGASEDAYMDVTKSLVSQLASVGTPVWDLALEYRQIATFLSWQFGPKTSIRNPQKTDGSNDVLSDDFSNLALVLSRIDKSASAKQTLLGHFRQIFEGVNDYRVIVEGGYAQVFLSESAFDKSIPASRLSDGTLRYLSLLAILCDPKPMSSTICLDEPELGLHPDLLPSLAKLMVEASERMQLIVTTHSDVIIDALSDTPEAVIVCERHEGQTTMRRLVASELGDWLKDYRLGQLWSKGTIGGNRW
ncbi:MAG: AAA family ATPase [Xanthomonadales bacterium]|nr:AAA family ATPase [Xanthomonadales bacterium]